MQEENEYMTLGEAASYVGVKKASLYYYIRALNIKTQKFPLNKHLYIARTDVEQIKTIKDSPWKVKSEEAEHEVA